MTEPLPQGNRYLHRIEPTPLVPIKLDDACPAIWCKLEFLNPSGSTKDRIARYILEKAWQQGRLRAGDLVMEASSGSTSIALALACAQMGLRFTAVMPAGVSNERVLIIKAYGGTVRFSPQAEGMSGAMAELTRLARDAHAFLPQQFSNPDNADAHRLGTAREIMSQFPPGQFIHAVVSGVGTGGTLVGLFQALRESGHPVVPVLARPINVNAGADPECCSFSSRIPGVVDSLSSIFQEDRLPGLLKIEVSDEEALVTTRRLIRLGFPVGPSSGLNYLAALKAAQKLPVSNPAIMTVFPDRMERYFTTELFRQYVGKE